MSKQAERILEDFLNEWSSTQAVPEKYIDNSFDEVVMIAGTFTREELLGYMQAALDYNEVTVRTLTK